VRQGKTFGCCLNSCQFLPKVGFLYTCLTPCRKIVSVKTMPVQPYIYFDTDAFHRIGRTFATQGLPNDLRERILVSPITLLEALSHLTLKSNAGILADIQAIHNWVNPNHAGLLSWPSNAIAKIGFNADPKPDDFMERIQKTLNQCLATDSPEDFRESADKLKIEMDRMKDSSAEDFQRLVESQRKEPFDAEQFSKSFVTGIAKRAGADPGARPVADVVSCLSAYYEFEEDRLRTAVSNPQYKPDKNDLLDAEQLVYLGSPELRFLACDGGYFARIKKSPQLAQMRRATVDELSTPEKVESLLREIVA
jgi:hypothetical protein